MKRTDDGSVFFRRYRVSIGNAVFCAEFDAGFLTPEKQAAAVHNHADAEWIAGAYGISTIEAADVRYTLGRGDILFLPAGLYHSNRPGTAACGRLCFRLRFLRGDPLGEAYPLCTLLASRTSPLCLHDETVLSFLEMIRTEYLSEAPDTGCDELVLGLLTVCLVRLLRLAAAETEPIPVNGDPFTPSAAEKQVGRSKMIDRFFSVRYASPVTLTDLAADLHLSRTQTNRILRAEFGVAFREKLRLTRMQEAKRLLCETDVNIGDIAGIVGYESVSGFFTAFRNAFGMTPDQMRKYHTEKTI